MIACHCIEIHCRFVGIKRIIDAIKRIIDAD